MKTDPSQDSNLIHTECSSCHKRFKVPSTMVGKTVACKLCQGRFKILVVPDVELSEIANQKTGLLVKNCPSCSKLVGFDVVVCVSCGYDFNTGRKYQKPVVSKSPPVSERIVTDNSRLPIHESTIECPFCREEIKASAIKCKHCGSTLSTSTIVTTSAANKPILSIDRHLSWKEAIVATFCFLAVGFVIFCYMIVTDDDNKEQQALYRQSQSLVSQPIISEQPTDITWKQYLADCGTKAQRDNEIRAETIFRQQYDDKLVRWSGVIGNFSTGLMGDSNTVRIKMDPTESMGEDISLNCPSSKDLTSLKKGERISFTARINIQGGALSQHQLTWIAD